MNQSSLVKSYTGLAVRASGSMGYDKQAGRKTVDKRGLTTRSAVIGLVQLQPFGPLNGLALTGMDQRLTWIRRACRRSLGARACKDGGICPTQQPCLFNRRPYDDIARARADGRGAISTPLLPWTPPTLDPTSILAKGSGTNTQEDAWVADQDERRTVPAGGSG